MEELRPSRTALRVALRRAAHQIYDAKPLVFNDPVAVPVLGEAFAEELRRTPVRETKAHSRALRAWLCVRSRYAEDLLNVAVADGLEQYVVLGAGLDTFGLRNPYGSRLRVFEVDHPATQAWKRELAQKNGFSLDRVTLVPVDFERQSLAEELARAGFDPRMRAFFAWLGVVPYLGKGAFKATLERVLCAPEGSGLVLDYGQPRHVLPPLEQLAHDSLADRVRLAGEPFQLFFTPEEMAAELRGFSRVEDLGRDELNERYFSGRSDGLKLMGTAARLVSGWVSPARPQGDA